MSKLDDLLDDFGHQAANGAVRRAGVLIAKQQIKELVLSIVGEDYDYDKYSKDQHDMLDAWNWEKKRMRRKVMTL